MKTKIVYVLISDGKDDFCEMTLLSIHSLRRFHPHDDVLILTDEPTRVLFTERYGLSPENALLVTIPVPDEFNNKMRSRYLKTTLRNHVSGDFLFLDCDTLVCDSLKDIDSFDMDIGCVPDSHKYSVLNDEDIIHRCSALGFSNVVGAPYYNSGVIYVKDSDVCRRFFDEWSRLWQEHATPSSVVDQPAFCQTNKNLGFPIHQLPDSWNCMIQLGGKPFLKNAKIIHYFSMDSCKTLPRNLLFSRLRELGYCDKIADHVCQNPKTIGYSAFSMDIGRGEYVYSFLFSEILPVYLDIQPLYRFFLFCSRKLYYPILRVIRIIKKNQ